MDDPRYRWQHQALCRGVEPEAFFPVSEEDAGRAKEICAACMVREECLSYSLQNRERYGVWGGVTEKERQEILRRGARPALSRGLVSAG